MNDQTVDPWNTDSLIHFTSDNLRVENNVVDFEFGVEFPGAFVVSRSTEYCQWMEHQTSHTKKDDEGNEETTYTYYYTKG